MPPKRKLPANSSTSNVMLFAHGLLGSAGQFVSCRKGKSAAYFFAEQGYDVWLGNARGTYFAQNHTVFNSSDARYWQFSWHEIGTIHSLTISSILHSWDRILQIIWIFFIGVYDLAAQIDYVLEKTKQKKLSLVGHSQGTTAGLVLLAERPEYNDKVFIFHGMTPPAVMRYFNKLFSPLVNNKDFVMVRFYSPAFKCFTFAGTLMWYCIVPLQHFLENFGIYDLAPHSFLAPIMKILGRFCEEPENVPLCSNAISLVMGRSAPQNWYPVRKEYHFFFAIKRN